MKGVTELFDIKDLDPNRRESGLWLGQPNDLHQ